MTVKVPGASSGDGTTSASTPSVGTEVTLYAVDKAFLDLLPYPLPAIQEQMVLRLLTTLSDYDVTENRIAPGAVRAVFDTLLRRCANALQRKG